MTVRLRHLLAVLATAATVATAGCGGSEEPKGSKLPGSSVSELSQRLNEIQRRYDFAKENDNPGACDDIQRDSFKAVRRTIDSLPQDVDRKLRDAVTQSFANLQQLTEDGCKDVSSKTETDTTPTETAPAPAPPPVPTPPETTPTETAPPTTAPQEEKKSKSKEKDNGQGTGGTNGTDGSGGTGGAGGGTQAPGANGE